MISGQVNADSSSSENWLVSGFGTLGYSQTDKYETRTARRNIYQSGDKLRNNGFLIDSRFGLQLTGHLGEHWEAVGQILVREQLSKHVEDYINMAFVRYRVNNEWQISLGRQAFDVFFLSDHRNIGYSYEWVRPPTEFYGFIPNDSFDGIKISKNWGDFGDDWQWTLSVGNIKAKFDSDVVGNTSRVDSAKMKPMYSTELSWQAGQWEFRSSIALLKFKQKLEVMDLLDQLAPVFQPIWPEFSLIVDDFPSSYQMRYGTLGVAWLSGDWKIKSEWSFIEGNAISFNGQRAYLHLAKRWQDWQVFSSLGYAKDDNKKLGYVPPHPSLGLDNFYTGMVESIAEISHNQRSISVGLRWDFAAQKALKLQCDQFHFKAGSGSIYGRTDQRYRDDETRSWCSATLDWIF